MLKKLDYNKRGDVTDILIFLILVFAFAVSFFILTFVISEISEGLLIAGLNNTAEGANAISELSEYGVSGIQNGFFLLFVGFIISTLITSFMVRTHPVFMFLYIFVLGLTIFISPYLGNAYDDIATNPIFATQLQTQVLINVVMNNIVTISLAVGALSMIIVFSKFSSFRGATPGQL